MRRLIIGCIALALILISATVIAALRPDSDLGVNLIAFVSSDGDVMTISPDGLQLKQISPEVEEGFFTWPTWSPDGRMLVYSGLVNDGGELQLNLYASDISGDAERVLYASERGEVGLLAKGVVHYPLWSPDSESLAFIVTTSDGLSLFMDDLSDSPDARHLLDDGPLWMSWSADSSRLAVHRGDEHFLVVVEGEPSVRALDVSAIGYRVPAWRPVVNSITIRTQPSLLKASVSSVHLDGTKVQLITPLRSVDGDAAFLWSSSGRYLAVAEAPQYLVYRDTVLPLYGGVAVVPADLPQDAVELTLPTLAFFWSPDGSKIALVTPSDRPGALSWALYDVERDERTLLADFIPSSEQLTMFQFFDQYAYSHSVWSPNSESIVFSGNLITDSVSASVSGQTEQSSFQIVVVDTEPVVDANVIGEGIMGFWAPR